MAIDDKDIKAELKKAKAVEAVIVSDVPKHEVSKHNDTDSYLLTKRAEQLSLEEGQGPELLDRESTLERIAALDVEFAAMLKATQNNYLEEANDILKECMAEIRKRIGSGDEKLRDVVNALDVLSNKYNNFLGLPTNVQGHLHKHQVETVSKKPSQLTEEELDAHIEETRDFLNYRALGEAANAQ